MRLIDADELKEHLFVGADYDKAIDDGIAETEEEVFAFQCGWNDALKSVEQFAPTVDAVEVVRCKDCVNCSECITDDGMHSYIRCLWKGATICENDYCSWGERREDEID